MAKDSTDTEDIRSTMKIKSVEKRPKVDGGTPRWFYVRLRRAYKYNTIGLIAGLFLTLPVAVLLTAYPHEAAIVSYITLVGILGFNIGGVYSEYHITVDFDEGGVSIPGSHAGSDNNRFEQFGVVAMMAGGLTGFAVLAVVFSIVLSTISIILAPLGVLALIYVERKLGGNKSFINIGVKTVHRLIAAYNHIPSTQRRTLKQSREFSKALAKIGVVGEKQGTLIQGQLQ
jgi:hypothetical protein